MKIYSVHDVDFKEYGRVITGYDIAPIVTALEKETPVTDKVVYVPSEPLLENLPVAQILQSNEFGGMPMQLGWCNGKNTKLNCLEYHRGNEINLGATDFILLLARLPEIENEMLDTAKVKAFYCPKGTMIEVYATTLHYAPCQTNIETPFKVMVGLAKGTNTAKPQITALNEENKKLGACNKWVLAHPDSEKAKKGGYVGLKGENIDIANQL